MLVQMLVIYAVSLFIDSCAAIFLYDTDEDREAFVSIGFIPVVGTLLACGAVLACAIVLCYMIFVAPFKLYSRLRAVNFS